MPPSRTRLLAAVVLALATVAGALAADGGQDGGGKPQTMARTVSGTISSVAWADARITVDTSGGPLTLRIDRNTAVFLDSRLGSARDLVVGTPVRASFGEDERAVWVEVRPRASGPAAARDGGSELPDGGAPPGATSQGPPVLPPPAGAPAAGGAADGGPAAAPDAGTQPAPGSAPAGPAPPEPNPGVTPPRPPPPPGPSGPGPVPIGPER